MEKISRALAGEKGNTVREYGQTKNASCTLPGKDPNQRAYKSDKALFKACGKQVDARAGQAA